MQARIAQKRDQWNKEAEMAFAHHGQRGTPMHRETWANGQVMVGWQGALPNQYIPLERAIAIYRDGWTIRLGTDGSPL